MEPIPYGRQDINDSDIQAVLDVLKSDFITQGQVVPSFEKAVAGYCGASYALAMNSATSALHLACLALGVGEGDIVWTTPITFVATANCARYCGADVDFVDIDSNTYNISVDSLEKKLEEAEKVGKLPSVIIPVHLSGQSCEMEAISKLSKRYGFKVIEDASHAIGGKYQGSSIGNCKYSDITIFSFHPVKIITTGEGGMALTNQQPLAEKMEQLRSHGVTRDPLKMTHVSDGPWYYQQIDLGYNYRMTDIQAALGLSQLKRLDDFIKKRHAIAGCYNNLLKGLPIKLPIQHSDTHSAFHLYIIRLQLGKIDNSHKKIFAEIRDQGIGINLHYIPLYLQPYYRKIGYEIEAFKNANSYYAEAISLPIYPALTKEKQEHVVNVLQGAIFA